MKIKYSNTLRNILFVCLFLGGISCNVDDKSVELVFKSPQNGKEYSDRNAIEVVLESSSRVDSVQLFYNRKYFGVSTKKAWSIIPEKFTMGENLLVAIAWRGGKPITKKYTQFFIKPQTPPANWKCKVLRKFSHNTADFTQGLLFHNGKLYESTGEKGHSKIMVKNPNTGIVEKECKLDSYYFGEGITESDGKIWQITWTAGMGFCYDAQTLKKQATFSYAKHSPQGWGITTIGDRLVMSNGSHQLLFFNKPNMTLSHWVDVYSSQGKQELLNELEYAKGYVFANVWFKNYIVVIEPKTGKVVSKIDCSKLVAEEMKLGIDPQDEVLNGIAYRSDTDTFFLTGKRWHYIYEVRIESGKVN